MAKQFFEDGVTVVSADFLNSIYYTADGHVHDGGSDDGSAEKIDVVDHVDWGTNAAFTKTADSVSSVQYRLDHSGAGYSLLRLDRLILDGGSLNAPGGLYVGTAPSTADLPLYAGSLNAAGNAAVGADLTVGVDVNVAGDVYASTVDCNDVLIDDTISAALGNFTVDSDGDVVCREISGGGGNFAVSDGGDVTVLGSVSAYTLGAGGLGEFSVDVSGNLTGADATVEDLTADSVVAPEVPIAGAFVSDMSTTPSVDRSFGTISTVTRNGAGDYDITFSPTLSATAIVQVGLTQNTSVDSSSWTVVGGGVNVRTYDGGAAADIGEMHITVWDW